MLGPRSKSLSRCRPSRQHGGRTITGRANMPASESLPRRCLRYRRFNNRQECAAAHDREGRARCRVRRSNLGEGHGRPTATHHLGNRHRRDLRALRARVHAAVAGVGDHQFRARRVRHGPRLPDAVLHQHRRPAALARLPADLPGGDGAARLHVQARDGRPADPPWRDSAGHCHAGPVDRRQAAGQGRRDRASAAIQQHLSRTACFRWVRSRCRTWTSARWCLPA